MLNLISLPPNLIESLIALSIAYIAAENLWSKQDQAERWWWLLSFGLIHGMGFVGSLREMSLLKVPIPVSPVSFNVGVEIGLLAFIGVDF